MAKRHLFVAYFLWLIFGVFGLHHLYLRRLRHFFLWSVSFGGFGVGWLREIYKIPEYVDAANGDLEYYEDLRKLKVKKPVYPFSFVRFIGALSFGIYFYYISSNSFDALIGIWPSNLVGVVCASIGVWFVGELGHQTSSYKITLIGAVIGLIVGQLNIGYDPFYVSLGATVGFFYARSWHGDMDRLIVKKSKMGCCGRLFTISLYACYCNSIFWYMTLSALYFHFSFEVEGERLLLREHVHNILRSPAFAQLSIFFWEMIAFVRTEGFAKSWEKFVDSLDVQGENRSYRVIGLSSSATQEQIRAECKKLRLKWHPDKVSSEDKEEATKKFPEIQEACKTLLDIHDKRSKKTDDEPKQESDSKDSNEGGTGFSFSFGGKKDRDNSDTNDRKEKNYAERSSQSNSAKNKEKTGSTEKPKVSSAPHQGTKVKAEDNRKNSKVYSEHKVGKGKSAYVSKADD